MKSCIDFYDDDAIHWANEWYTNDSMMPFLKEFLNYIHKPKARILDLCCGCGYESMRLASLGADVVGADLSEKSLNIAREKNPKISFYKKDMLESYADLGEFDGIACIAGIIHIEENKLERVFQNMDEVLNDDGYLLLVFKTGGMNKQTIELNGEVYARNFIYHTKTELNKHCKNYFNFVKDLTPSIDNSGWKFYIYKKK